MEFGIDKKELTPTLAAAAILFLMDPAQKLIRSSEIPREQPYRI